MAGRAGEYFDLACRYHQRDSLLYPVPCLTACTRGFAFVRL
jgi:hypothetical protein